MYRDPNIFAFNLIDHSNCTLCPVSKVDNKFVSLVC